MQPRRKIVISDHARQRLHQRVPEMHSSEYRAFASSALYNGMSKAELYHSNRRLYEFVDTHFWEYSNPQIKVFKNCVCVFNSKKSKVRTLITVVNLLRNDIDFVA